MHPVVGVSERCIASHPSDLAVALVALDALVLLRGEQGERRVALTDFYTDAVEDPARENVLAHGELITGIEIPLLPIGTRSTFLKVRDRASYEFALPSAGVALAVTDGMVWQARVALGGVGSRPWRA